MKRILKTILFVFAISALIPAYTQSDQVPVVKDEEVILSPIAYADKYAEQYQIDASVFKKVMFCESGNNPNAVGDKGLAKNVMQFHKSTFDLYSKQFYNIFEIKLDYNSYHDQIELATWMWSNNQQSNWTCYHKVVRA